MPDDSRRGRKRWLEVTDFSTRGGKSGTKKMKSIQTKMLKMEIFRMKRF